MMQLNLAKIDWAVDALGPGRRVIVWVQGCPRRCPGCITPQMLEFIPAQIWSIPALLDFLRQYEPYEGLTFVGGEPLSQAAGLVELIDGLRAERDVGIVTYTGYTLQQLQAAGSSAWTALLQRTDLLVDGEFVQAESGNYLWRGSGNQMLHFLTDRYAEWRSQADTRATRVSLRLDGDQLQLIGIPNPHLLEVLAKHGFHVR